MTRLIQARSVFFVTGATVAVGVVTLLQDILLAASFATGTSVDAYQLAIALPVAGINIFAGGTVQSLLIPIFVRTEHAGGSAAAAGLVAWAHRALLIVLCGALLVLAALFIIGAPLVATSFSADTLALSHTLFWSVLPLFFFGGLSSLYVTALNSIRAHALAALLPILTPAAAVAALLTLGKSSGVASVAWGASLGALLQYLLAKTVLGQRGYGSAVATLPANGAGRRIRRDYWLLVIAATLLGGILLTDIILATTLTAGDTATFGFASRPVMLGLAFLTIIASNITLPHYSDLVAKQDWRGLAKSYLVSVRSLLIISVPVILACHFFANGITALIYQRGAFSAADSQRVAQILRILIWQVPFYLTAMIGLRVANAIGKNYVLLLISLTCFVLNLATGLLLVRGHGLSGIAAATVITFAIWAGLVTYYVHGLCRKRIHEA
ncbi:murein biosynthesis integral membrane protein MurJ [Georgfuchsia toluolica]|uniref:murein biosynthesis integral membrane protein MurJ n=1 Tax=Georgfuchsia toluolica TaxID=424218 RepID=UPI001C72A9EC|nr:lipid II flippase MurJ [Georgfuchsia toluolica]